MVGEKLVYGATLHWVIFLKPVNWLILAFVSSQIFSGSANAEAVGIISVVIFILMFVLAEVAAFVNFLTSEFGVTNKRVMVKVGFIRRHSLEVLLNKVEGIQVSQGIWARILGYGSIIVSGTGGTKDPFTKITRPLEFRKKAQEQIAIVQEAK